MKVERVGKKMKDFISPNEMEEIHLREEKPTGETKRKIYGRHEEEIKAG